MKYLWDLREQPMHLLVMGGGPIGIEMAQAHLAAGFQSHRDRRHERLWAKTTQKPPKSFWTGCAPKAWRSSKTLMAEEITGKRRRDHRRNQRWAGVQRNAFVDGRGAQANTSRQILIWQAGIDFDRGGIKVDAQSAFTFQTRRSMPLAMQRAGCNSPMWPDIMRAL